MRTDRDGRGIVNILAADKLMDNPRLYATFLLWLMSELFEELPEVGDLDKPKLVFFFDEAHLLFNDAPQGAGRNRWSRSCASSAPRASASISSRRTRSTCRTPCSRSSATACSTRCAPSRRATRRRCASPRRPSARTPRSTPRRRSPNSASARPWSRCWKARARPRWSSARMIAPPIGQVGPIDAAERQRIVPPSPVRGKYEQAIDPRIRLRDAGQARRKGAPAGRQGRAEAGRAASSTCSAGPGFGTAASAASTLSVGQTVAREVPADRSTRRSAGSPPNSANRSAGARAAPSAGPSCAEPWAGC